jgi:pimeloyl-ACP methyl ester carboxylesterase
MERVISADGTPIAYKRTGDGPSLVLVHGATVDHTTWTQSLPFLEEEFTVYAIDRRGRGESGDAEEYALEREVEDVIAIIEAISEPVDLLGHSFGGLISLEAALRTDTVHRLILYEGFPHTKERTDEQQALPGIRNVIERGDREEALTAFYREIGHLSREEIEYIQSQPTWQQRVDAVHTALREVEEGYEYDFEPDRFRELDTPTLLLVGGESQPIEHQDAETLCDVLLDCRIARLEGQQHVAYRMAPELFTQTVIEFLSKPL